MNVKISRLIAQRIVDAVNEVCNCPINFIDRRGIIIASTDPARMNQYHEAGWYAVQKASVVTVEKDLQYNGAKAGVNYPIMFEGSVVGVIGITGEASEVEKYGFLATKVSEVFIKEQYLISIQNSKKQKMNYLLRSLIYNHTEDEAYVSVLSKEMIDDTKNYCVLCVRIHKRYNLENIGMLENKIEHIFKSLNATCYTYLYPNEFICLLLEEQVNRAKSLISELGNGLCDVVKAGIGIAEPVLKLYQSYDQARYAIDQIEDTKESCQLFTELGLERVLRVLSRHLSKSYTERVLNNLTAEEKELLRSYFEHNQNLKETASNNFIHINTLQNKLNKIYEKNGLNPRCFQDAVALYLSILVEAMR